MKNLFVGLLVTAMVTVLGCSVPGLPEPTGEIVKVEREMHIVYGNPGIKLSCDSVTLDYNGRKIVVEGVKQFGSLGEKQWVGNINIEGNKLVLEIPSDVEYDVWIGKQKHILPKIVGKE